MEGTKGLKVRRICGLVQSCVGAVFLLQAILLAVDGLLDFLGIFASAFTILAGILGYFATAKVTIIAYMVTCIICAPFYGYFTYRRIDSMVRYGANFFTILFAVIALLTCIASVVGLIYAILPWCKKKQEQDESQQHNYNPVPDTTAVSPPIMATKSQQVS